MKNSLFRDWAICFFIFLPCASFGDPGLFQQIPSYHPALEGALSVSLLGAHLILPAPLLEMLTSTSFSSEGLAPAWHTVSTWQVLTFFFFFCNTQGRAEAITWSDRCVPGIVLCVPLNPQRLCQLVTAALPHDWPGN